MSQSQEVQQAPAAGSIPLAAELQARTRVLKGFWKAVAIAFGSSAILLALNQLLNLGFFVGEVLLDTAYLYVLAALLVGLVFLFVPATKMPLGTMCHGTTRCFCGVCWCFCYFAFNSFRIISEAWEFMSPQKQWPSL